MQSNMSQSAQSNNKTLQNTASIRARSKDSVFAHLADFRVDVVVAHFVPEPVVVVVETARVADEHVSPLCVGFLDDGGLSCHVEWAEEVSFPESAFRICSRTNPQFNVAVREVHVAHVADGGAAEADLVVVASVVSAVEELREALGRRSGIGGESSIIFREISHTGSSRKFTKSDVDVDLGVEDEVVGERVGLVALVVQELEFEPIKQAISVGEVDKHDGGFSLESQADVGSRRNHSHVRDRTGESTANQDGKEQQHF